MTHQLRCLGWFRAAPLGLFKRVYSIAFEPKSLCGTMRSSDRPTGQPETSHRLCRSVRPAVAEVGGSGDPSTTRGPAHNWWGLAVSGFRCPCPHQGQTTRSCDSVCQFIRDRQLGCCAGDPCLLLRQVVPAKLQRRIGVCYYGFGRPLCKYSPNPFVCRGHFPVSGRRLEIMRKHSS